MQSSLEWTTDRGYRITSPVVTVFSKDGKTYAVIEYGRTTYDTEPPFRVVELDCTTELVA
jgi:hypothetical protein